MNEVDAPNVIGILRPQADDGSVFVIEAFAFLVMLRQLQTFFSPQSLHLLVIDLPAFNTQEFSDLSIAVTPILLDQTN